MLVRRPPFRLRAALALLLLLGTGAARAVPTQVEPLVLPNGLQVFLRPVADAKEVALVVVFRIGGDHDPAGKSGLAHLVEHCYVTAAADTTPARTSTDLLDRYPGGHTAQTADRHTIVAALVPSDRLEAELEDAAARMGHLEIADADLAREKPRVLEEVGNMFDRIPPLMAHNRAREIVLPNRAGGRRAGSPEHVAALTREDVTAWWTRHYKPGNAVLALVGGFDAAKTRDAVAKHFGPIARGEPPPPMSPAPSSTAAGARVDEVELEWPSGREGRACVAFAAPAPSSEDYAAFLLFVARLTEVKIPREGFQAPVTFAPLDEPGALYVSAPLAPGETNDAALAALHGYVAGVVAEPWSPADTPRVLDRFGLLLGLVRTEDWALAPNPYPLALGLAVRPVLGVDPDALRKRLDALKTAPLSAIGKRLFDPLTCGAAVVRTRAPK